LWNPDGLMDHLLGQPYPYFIHGNERYLVGVDNGRWSVSWDMLTENKPLVPNYKKRVIIKEL